MGQRYVPDLHDPKCCEIETQDNKQLTEEAKCLFNAAIAKLDAERGAPDYIH